MSRFHDYYLWFLTQAQAYYEENDWEPIFGLVSRLQNLRLLNYIVMNMFPTCLYQTLERLHPNCQVNIWTPQSPSIDQPGLGRAHGHVSLGCNQPFDLNALSAPTLHTFHAVYTFDTDPQDRQRWVHIDEPFTFIFTAPNLKHLVIDARDGRGENPLLSVKEEWQKLTLESFTFRHEAYRAHERVLLNLSTMIDLSILRSLDIGVHSEPALLSQAASMLVGLECLYIHMLPHNKRFKSRPGHLQSNPLASGDAEAPALARGSRRIGSLQAGIGTRHSAGGWVVPGHAVRSPCGSCKGYWEGRMATVAGQYRQESKWKLEADAVACEEFPVGGWA